MAQLFVEPKSISNYSVILEMGVQKNSWTTSFGSRCDQGDILGEADTDKEDSDDTDENHDQIQELLLVRPHTLHAENYQKLYINNLLIYFLLTSKLLELLQICGLNSE